MSSFVIRSANEVSTQEYKQLRLEALKEEPQAFATRYDDQKNVSDDQWQEWLQNYKDEKHNFMLFAQYKNELIGMIGAFQKTEDIEKNRAQIIAVYVKKSHREKGISTMLLSEMLSLLKRKNIQQVYLCVNVDQIAAVTLYQHAGFVVIKKENMILGDNKMHEEYIMEKKV